MATAKTISLYPTAPPDRFRPGTLDEGGQTASRLLQDNHEKHHCFWSPSGFHNHIAHQLLTLYALGATSEQLQAQYDVRKKRIIEPADATVVERMNDPGVLMTYLGDEAHYTNFLAFFEQEIEGAGWQEVLQKYIFAGTEIADALLVRMFSGFLHPLIHLGFGVESHQPAIIAEALAQAACHAGWLGDLLLTAEELAKQQPIPEKRKSIVQLLTELQSDDELKEAVQWEDDNKIRDGLLARAPEQMLKYASQVVVNPNELNHKTAEMVSAVTYYSAASQHPSGQKAIKFDFYFMHCVNCSLFFASFLGQPWLDQGNKARLLEWKIRVDIIMYASRRSPALLPTAIQDYRPKSPEDEWNEIEDRACRMEDDAHGSKLVRAIKHGEHICRLFDREEGFVLRSADWLKVAHMAIDSTEMEGKTWVRSAGFEEAWADIPERNRMYVEKA